MVVFFVKTKPTNMTKKKTDRALLQVQGGELEASETWEQVEPLSKKQRLFLCVHFKPWTDAKI